MKTLSADDAKGQLPWLVAHAFLQPVRLVTKSRTAVLVSEHDWAALQSSAYRDNKRRKERKGWR